MPEANPNLSWEQRQEIEEKKPFIPTDEERSFIVEWYSKFSDCYQLSQQSYREMNDRTPAQFWRDSIDAYNVFIPPKRKADWKRQFRSTLTRDKANAFISRLTQAFITAQVMAQNQDQQIDRAVSRVFSKSIEWWGRLAKADRIQFDGVHTGVVEGTLHFQTDVVTKNGRPMPVRTVVPNSEIFIPNYYQPDLQQQAYIFRARKRSYREAHMQYRKFPYWNYVYRGPVSNWSVGDIEFFKQYNAGRIANDEVQELYLQWTDPEKPDGRKFVQLFVNGVPLLALNKKSPYSHKQYNFVKQIFEKFNATSAGFYWGNSLPNKLRQEQGLKDTLTTIVVNKEILNLLPPMVSRHGHHLGSDVVSPAKVTPVRGGDANILQRIPGVAEPITSGDLAVLQLVNQQADEGSMPPQSMGLVEPGGKRTLGEMQMRDERASELLLSFGLMTAWAVEDLAYQDLFNIVQYVTKQNIAQIVDGSEFLFRGTMEIPQQILKNGQQGSMMVEFNAEPTTPEALLEREFASEKAGNPIEITRIDPVYLRYIDWYCFVVANPVRRKSEALESLEAFDQYQTLAGNPIFNQVKNARTFLNARKLYEDDWIVQPQAVSPMTPTVPAAARPEGMQKLAQSRRGQLQLRQTQPVGV